LDDFVNQLEKLAKLYEQGPLSADEHQLAKDRLMGNASSAVGIDNSRASDGDLTSSQLVQQSAPDPKVAEEGERGPRSLLT
jgi:hypothetical protein